MLSKITSFCIKIYTSKEFVLFLYLIMSVLLPIFICFLFHLPTRDTFNLTPETQGLQCVCVIWGLIDETYCTKLSVESYERYHTSQAQHAKENAFVPSSPSSASGDTSSLGSKGVYSSNLEYPPPRQKQQRIPNSKLQKTVAQNCQI